MVTEAQLAETSGIDRETLRVIRDEALEHGKDWVMKKGEVTLTREAAQRVLELAAGAQGDVSTRATVLQAEKEAPRASQERQAVVCRVLPRCRNIIMALLDEKEVRVYVHESVNFVERMPITIRHRQEDLWELVGRCPRARGRW